MFFHLKVVIIFLCPLRLYLLTKLAIVVAAARRHKYSEMSEEIDGPDKINTAPGEGGNTDGDNDGGSGPPMSMRGGRGGFR